MIDLTTSFTTELTPEQALGQAMGMAGTLTHNGHPVDFLQAIEATDSELSFKAAMLLHDLANEIQKAVVRDDRFPGMDVISISRDNNGRSGFYPNFFGRQLLTYALRSNSASSAINWLLSVLNTETAAGKIIFLLWGIAVTASIDISPTITLKTPDAASEPMVLEWISKMYDNGRYEELTPSWRDWTRPSAVLVMNTIINPFAQKEPAAEQSINDALSDYYALKDVMLLLAVASSSYPVLAAYWTVIDNPELAAACWGTMRMGTMHEITASGIQDPTQIEVEVIQRCVGGFQSADEPTRATVRMALKRIIQARMRHDVGDRAVEICIALEALAGNGESNEISHKVAARFARYLGGDLEQRRATFKLIKGVYNIRSKVVHGNGNSMQLTKLVGGLTVSGAIQIATELASSFILKVLESGSFPVWPDFDVS